MFLMNVKHYITVFLYIILKIATKVRPQWQKVAKKVRPRWQLYNFFHLTNRYFPYKMKGIKRFQLHTKKEILLWEIYYMLD